MKTETKQFEADYLVHQPAMQRMAESLLGNEDEAADVVQDCFVTLWSERKKLKKVVNREAWCITLVKRRCVDLMRRRHPSVGADYLANLADEDHSDEDERLQLALRFLDSLPEQQQKVVRLKHHHHRPHPVYLRGQRLHSPFPCLQVHQTNDIRL